VNNRSAHATIKGYFYQFDHTIVRILDGTTPQSSIIVEGIEDIDLDDGDNSAFVQCKYYEGSEYNHSVIKEAVIQMLKHFHGEGCPAGQKIKYRIYGHYKGGQKKLPAAFDLNFLKKNFLTYKHNKKTHEVHKELNVNDIQLSNFNNLLEIDLYAPSYDVQQNNVIKLLVSQIPGCNSEDAKVFYYPNAINVIQSLAIQSDENKRKITKKSFVSRVNRKGIVFSLWLREKFGNDYYAKYIKRKYFKFSSTKVPKASRIFVIDMTDEFDLSKAVALLNRIGSLFSHKEHIRTPQQDRFCPYVLLRGLSRDNLISLKNNLLEQGINFIDGYPFHDSDFSPKHLVAEPTKENLIRIKFIPVVEQLVPVISAIKGSVIELFDFHKGAPVEAKYLPKGISYNDIKIESTHFISEVLTV